MYEKIIPNTMYNIRLYKGSITIMNLDTPVNHQETIPVEFPPISDQSPDNSLCGI